MARTENTKTSKSALLIICEGKVTEPLFFDGIKRTMRLDFDILPKPPLEDEDKECHSSRGQARRKRKHLKMPLTVNEKQEEQKKAGTNFYPLLAPHLLTGISNATLLRRQSIATYPALKIYERNPYVDVDKLVTMLLGHQPLDIGESIMVKDGAAKLTISRTVNSIEIQNTCSTAYSIQQEIASIFKKSTETIAGFNIVSKVILPGDPPAVIDLSVLSPGDIIFLDFGRTTILSVISSPPSCRT